VLGHSLQHANGAGSDEDAVVVGPPEEEGRPKDEKEEKTGHKGAILGKWRFFQKVNILLRFSGLVDFGVFYKPFIIKDINYLLI
jgi:hypothetical protein